MMTQHKSTTISYAGDRSLSLWEKIALVIVSSGLLILSAKIMVPVFNVPITMQPFTVICLGIALGPRLALAATLTYILEGAAGLPVYADSLSYPGMAVLMKPSAGFILSFPFTAFIAGYLTEKGWTKNLFQALGLFVIGYTIMYICGVAYLMSFIGLSLALQNMLAWVPADLAKIGLGAAGARLFSRK